MRLSSLIAQLQKIEAESGDLRCYTNGEYGGNNQIYLTANTVSVGSAEVELTEDMYEVETDLGNIEGKDTVVLHIGGY